MEYILNEEGYNGKGKIKYIINENKCWICIHPKANNGTYLYVTRNGKQIYTHRYSYKLAKGKIENNLQVMHACDNPKCINPKHLSLGTAKDNAQDKVQKGRAKQSDETKKLRSKLWTGEKNPMYGKKPKNTIKNELRKQIEEEINIKTNEKWQDKEKRISEKFNVSFSTIRRIKYGYTK